MRTKAIKLFLTTQLGWLTRKGLELVAIGVAAVSAYALKYDIPGDVVSSGTTFLTALGGYLVTLILSRVADAANKEAEPPRSTPRRPIS